MALMMKVGRKREKIEAEKDCWCEISSGGEVMRWEDSISYGFSPVLMSREGNGTPLQYSCLENLMDGGAWKATVHGVAEGRT